MVEWKIDQVIDYLDAVKTMEERVAAIRNGTAQELVWLLEHPPIYTAGNSARDGDIIEPLFPVIKTGRGGKYTYHGPGQRIIYLLLDLQKRKMCDIKLYVGKLTEWIINVLSSISVVSYTDAEKIGIWVRSEGMEKKLVAFGIRVRRWVTYHGIAINICPDLSHYRGIVPCGLVGYGVTSLESLGLSITACQIDNVLKREFYNVFPL